MSGASIGPAAVAAVPALARLLNEPAARVRRSAADAIRDISGR
jgi:vesicle coat complex subunit